jgi:hypothetical protein
MALNVLLVVLVLVAFITGCIASWLAVTDFAPHRYSSIALIVCVSAHLCFHWRSLIAPLRRMRTPLLVPSHALAGRSGPVYALAADQLMAASDEVVPAEAPVLTGGP